MPDPKGGKPKAPPEEAIAALLDEQREYPPAPDFTKQAIVRDNTFYEQAEKDPESFWAGIASELDWFVRWEKTLEWTPPDAKWNANALALPKAIGERSSSRSIVSVVARGAVASCHVACMRGN